MRQKYTISREKKNKILSIKEYAVLERIPKGPAVLVGSEDHFPFLGEEIYDSSFVVDSIGKGINALVLALRTESMYPIWPHAIKIAESVMDLYDLGGNDTMDLFFDNVEQLHQSKTMAD